MAGQCCCLVCIKSSEAGIIERCGEYKTVTPPGPHFVLFPCDCLSNVLSMRVRMLEVICDTKTLDNVFTTVKVAVMFKVTKDSVYQANYTLTDVESQIRSYINDVLRSSLPKLELDAAFVSKDALARDCQMQLSKLMDKYGYEIVNVLVIDLEPDKVVKASMNEINAASRIRTAAAEKAEAEKILQVKAAEADADSKYLSGQGVARQRTAIVDGLRSTVTDFNEVNGTTPSDVLDLLLMTQYFDMMKEVGVHSKGNSLFLDHAPTSVSHIRKDLRENFMANKKKS
jgi:regulator of protease activity HflC (stomatin/prohibitin superfamily)